ncbi:uncharacterized protein BO97DRAFT_312680, partial [Aspergillus homomorphus CBS 101889]
NLLNTTWTIHRLSPLHHGKEFPSLLDNEHALKTYAARLRDHITGTSSTGTTTSTFKISGPTDENPSSSSSSKTGALVSCTWDRIPTLSLSGHATTTTSLPDDNTNANANTTRRGRPRRAATTPGTPGGGILITLHYETQTYRAALLTPSTSTALSSPSSSSDHNNKAAPKRTLRSRSHAHSTHLPLLLTKLPAPLRQTLVSFLASTFDTYCATLSLESGFLCGALSVYTRSLLGGVNSEDGEQGRHGAGEEGVVESVLRDLHIVLGFQGPVAPALRALDICVPRAAVAGLVAGGGGDDDDEDGDVLVKVGEYLDRHLAMKVDLKAVGNGVSPGVVRVTRIACGGFVLAADGKVKLVGPAAAASASADGVGAGEDDDEGGVPPTVAAATATALSLKDRLTLRAAEMLLLEVVRRAAGVEGEN